MRFIRCGLMLFLLLLSTGVGAQQVQPTDATAPDNAKAVTLLHASLAVLMGSAGALPSSLAASGTITQVFDKTSPPYSVLVHMQGADRFRWEVNKPRGTTVTVIDGQNAQLQSSSETKPLKAWEYGRKKLENFPIFLLARWLSADNMEIRLIGQETISGQSLNHISIIDYSQRMKPLNPWHSDKHRGEYELYLDPATSLPVRLHYYLETDDTYAYSLAPADIVYSDFRPSGGSIFPFNLTKYLGQTKISVLQLESIQTNVAVNAQAFQMR
jgi:outer membrane lipoprotein-sorting protein